MTKSEMLGKKYELQKKTTYMLDDSSEEVTFYPEMIFEVQDCGYKDENGVTLVTHFAGIEYRISYLASSLQRYTWLWKEVEYKCGKSAN